MKKIVSFGVTVLLINLVLLAAFYKPVAEGIISTLCVLVIGAGLYAAWTGIHLLLFGDDE